MKHLIVNCGAFLKVSARHLVAVDFLQYMLLFLETTIS